jgi:hypothetical protein
MMIGGIDIILEVPREVPVHQRIIDQVLRFWPGARFQDVDSDDDRPLAESAVRIASADSREFFIYRDQATAKSWQEDGASVATYNTMLHILVDHAPEGTGGRRVTIVCDDRTDQVEQIIAALQANTSGECLVHPAPSDVHPDSAPTNR